MLKEAIFLILMFFLALVFFSGINSSFASVPAIDINTLDETGNRIHGPKVGQQIFFEYSVTSNFSIDKNFQIEIFIAYDDNGEQILHQNIEKLIKAKSFENIRLEFSQIWRIS